MVGLLKLPEKVNWPLVALDDEFRAFQKVLTRMKPWIKWFDDPAVRKQAKLDLGLVKFNRRDDAVIKWFGNRFRKGEARTRCESQIESADPRAGYPLILLPARRGDGQLEEHPTPDSVYCP